MKNFPKCNHEIKIAGFDFVQFDRYSGFLSEEIRMVNDASRSVLKKLIVENKNGNTMQRYLTYFVFVLSVLCGVIRSEDRLLFGGVGLNYDVDISGFYNFRKELIGDLQFGYTVPNQQAEITLHVAFDFLNGYKKGVHDYYTEYIGVYSDSSIWQEFEHCYSSYKFIRFQLYLSSDIYIHKFFIRIQPRYYFDCGFQRDSSHSVWNRYENGHFVPYNVETQPLKKKTDNILYPGFMVGVGYRWKKIKFLVYNANVFNLGICVNYFFDILSRNQRKEKI